MRREERVTVQGPVKKPQPNDMSHGGGGAKTLWCDSMFERRGHVVQHAVARVTYHHRTVADSPSVRRPVHGHGLSPLEPSCPSRLDRGRISGGWGGEGRGRGRGPGRSPDAGVQSPRPPSQRPLGLAGSPTSACRGPPRAPADDPPSAGTAWPSGPHALRHVPCPVVPAALPHTLGAEPWGPGGYPEAEAEGALGPPPGSA